MAKLVAFYSQASEHYFGGQCRQIAVDNTGKEEKQIAALTGVTLFEIQQKTPLCGGLRELHPAGKSDQRAKARPELETLPDSLDGYDGIHLGYPNYWVDLPVAVYTRLKKFDWTAKSEKRIVVLKKELG